MEKSTNNPNGIYLFKVNNVLNLFKLTIKTAERRHCGRSGLFTINCEQISHIVQVFPLLTLNRSMLAGKAKAFK